MQYLLLLLFFSGFVISMIVTEEYSPVMWAGQFQSLLLFLFNPSYIPPPEVGDPLTSFVWFVIGAYTNPRTMQYLPIILAPFFIAVHSAGLYLADIFELSDVSVARKFIMEVALTGSDDTIRVSRGEISEEHLSSPNYLIGGPGKVVVDLDSVALFEKPDGTPHVIGPTGKEKGGKATLEGFERFRQAIDIRDHYVELRDQDDKSSSVKSRSLDGIPITATDVKLLFSVNREGKKPSRDEPYPFSSKSIEKLVYNAGSRVTPDQPNPSAFEFSWINNMVGLIRGKLGGFMSERKLTVYLASIGKPEVDKAKQRERKITDDARQIIPPSENPPKKKDIKGPPEFTPRQDITNLFSQFSEEFTKTSRDRGVELHWISIGTWKTPIEKVQEKHLEAWRISRENLMRGSEDGLKKLKFEAELRKAITLIQNLPLYSHQEAVKNYSERDDAIKALLLDYQRFLKDQLEYLQKNKLPIRPTIVAAIYYIDQIISHRLYPTPPKPETDRERELYTYLLSSIEMPEVIEKLVALKGELYPQLSREELLQLIVEDWEQDINEDTPHQKKNNDNS